MAVAGGMSAQSPSVAGFVVDGVIRDLDGVRATGFPVYARGVVPKPGKKAAFNPAEEVRVGGVRIRNGDFVLADRDGVVIAPAADAKRLLPAALARQEAEFAESED